MPGCCEIGGKQEHHEIRPWRRAKKLSARSQLVQRSIAIFRSTKMSQISLVRLTVFLYYFLKIQSHFLKKVHLFVFQEHRMHNCKPYCKLSSDVIGSITQSRSLCIGSIFLRVITFTFVRVRPTSGESSCRFVFFSKAMDLWATLWADARTDPTSLWSLLKIETSSSFFASQEENTTRGERGGNQSWKVNFWFCWKFINNLLFYLCLICKWV